MSRNLLPHWSLMFWTVLQSYTLEVSYSKSYQSIPQLMLKSHMENWMPSLHWVLSNHEWIKTFIVLEERVNRKKKSWTEPCSHFYIRSNDLVSTLGNPPVYHCERGHLYCLKFTFELDATLRSLHWMGVAVARWFSWLCVWRYGDLSLFACSRSQLWFGCNSSGISN